MHNECKHYNREVRGWIASGDIVMHEETCRDCGRSVYRKWHYNDGLYNTSRDTDTRVDWDYRPIASAAPEMTTKQAVDEIIADEKLSVEEILEKMPYGWILVSQEHFDAVIKSRDDYRHDLLKYLEINSYLHTEAGHLAYALSASGDYNHKEKNEVILRVIARLITMQRKSSPVKDAPLIDDIPF